MVSNSEALQLAETPIFFTFGEYYLNDLLKP